VHSDTVSENKKSGKKPWPREKLLMTQRFWIFALTSAFWFAPGVGIDAVRIDAQTRPLRLLQTIPLPGVHRRIDHMDVDTEGQRLFVAALENGSLEVVDLRAGKSLRSIPGFKKPQGIAFVRALNKVFVASGDDGKLRVFRADTLALLDTISLDVGPNRVLYDSPRSVLYVGYGGKDAGKDYGEVGIIDAKKDKLIADVRVDAHPAELLLDESGKRLFCFVSPNRKIQVIDTGERKVIATWPVSSERPGDGAFDAASHRLFIGTRKPPQIIVMDAGTGKEVSSLPTVEGMDGVYFDAKHGRAYVSGGRDAETGAVFTYQQKDADHYELIDTLATRQGAGTSLWVPELNRFYVGAPAHDAEDAAILVFEAQP
jgi:DNA-binding beta-propeller fold protein YncE